MLLYNWIVRLYGLAIRMAAVRNPKAKLWVKGRKNWRSDLKRQMEAVGNNHRIWVHCASYGEFEQGRPLIEAMKHKFRGCTIILSFFSPSGYQAFKDWQGADVVTYLPLDTRRNAEDFLNLVKPDKAVFVKYEFWVNFLFALKKRNISTYLVSAIFKPHHPFFKQHGKLFRRSLETFRIMFLQDENSALLLKGQGISNFKVSGDTRFDRVLEIKNNFTPVPAIERFSDGRQTLVAGSTWPADEHILLKMYRQFNGHLRLVIVPHEVDQQSIAETVAVVRKYGFEPALFSNHNDVQQATVLIVDQMGLLSRLYHYAGIAYVGGGFNEGIHNILEPAVYGIPVLFHEKTPEKYNEAVDLLALGVATNIKDEIELAAAINKHLSMDPNGTDHLKAVLAGYFQQRSNVTEKIVAQIQ
jgi:3-deoxy-D-manno-octulosonic-acid transferase